MKRILPYLLGALAVFSALNPQFSTSFAQGTAFTYQGQLKDGAAPANGSYDLTFSLFGVSSGGSAVGGPVIKLATLVTNGLFTILLDFGAGQFTSPARWLEIGVRTNGSGSFTTINPRQSLTPTPYAIYAASAGVGGGSPWLLNGTDTYYNGGRVGIGTTSPQLPLHIARVGNPAMALQDTSLDSQQSGFISFRNGSFTETAWVGFGTAGSPDFSIVNARSGGDIVLLPFSGNVGINTATPQAKLDVRGDIRLGPSGEFRAASGEENLRIIRGTVTGNGTINAGNGFTVSHVASSGAYTINFTMPFASAPSVTATAFNPGGNLRFATINTVLSSSALIVLWSDSSTQSENTFFFIAIGPR